MRPTFTRRMLDAIRQHDREARKTTRHFNERGKVAPLWCAAVIERTPAAVEYLSRRLSRARLVTV